MLDNFNSTRDGIYEILCPNCNFCMVPYCILLRWLSEKSDQLQNEESNEKSNETKSEFFLSNAYMKFQTLVNMVPKIHVYERCKKR